MYTNLYKALGVLFNRAQFEHQEDLELMVQLLKDYALLQEDREKHPYSLVTKSTAVEKTLDDFIQGHVDVTAFDNIIVFGSAADGTFIPSWSDYDILTILKDDDLAKQHEEIKKINDWLKKYNHHGVSVVFKEMMTRWCQNWMPLHILTEGYGYTGKSYDCLYYNDTSAYTDLLNYWCGYFKNAEETGAFQHHIRDGKYLTNIPSELLSRLYQFKYFLGVIFLLPCFLYNSQGKFWNKGICITQIHDELHLSKQSQWFLDQCCTIREAWGSIDRTLSKDDASDFAQKMFHYAHRLCTEISQIANIAPDS
jgi:predicted nucleotidyltransferase